MDEHTIKLLNECLPLVKEMHAILSDRSIPLWIAAPICGVGVALFGVLWAYHNGQMKAKDDIIVDLVTKVDAARQGERDALNDQINRNDTQVQTLSDLKHAMDNNTAAIQRLGGTQQ